MAMKSSMTQATHTGTIIVARFSRNKSGTGYMTAENKIVNILN